MIEIADHLRRTALTEENFLLRYDEEKTYYFFESEDGEVVYAYGHVDEKKFAKDVLEYYRYTSGDHYDDEEADGFRVMQTYAVGVVPIEAPEGEEEHYDLQFYYCAATEQMARPITVLYV